MRGSIFWEFIVPFSRLIRRPQQAVILLDIVLTQPYIQTK